MNFHKFVKIEYNRLSKLNELNDLIDNILKINLSRFCQKEK